MFMLRLILALSLLSGLAICAPSSSSSSSSSEDGGIPRPPLLAGNLLKDLVFASNDFWAVLIVDDEVRCGKECEMYMEVLAKATKSSGGVLRTGYLRALTSVVPAKGAEDEEETVHALFNVTHVPVMLLWAPGGGKRSEHTALVLPPEMVAGMLERGAKTVYDGLIPFIPSMVTTLRTPGFPSFFSDPECCPGRYSPVVLIHNNPKPSPVLKRLALEFSGVANFALVPGNDAAALKAWGLDNSSLPALLVGPRGFKLPPGVEKGSGGKGGKGGGGKKGKGGEESGSSSSSTSYLPPPDSLKSAGWKAFPTSPTSPMTYASLLQWLNTTLPPAPIPQLAGPADFDRAAKGGGILFIAVLPPMPESRGPMLAALRRAVGGWLWTVPDFESLSNPSGTFVASRPYFSFAWVDGGVQGEWAAAFQANTPGLIAYNPRKQVYSVMKGSLTEGNVKEFVEALVIPLHPRAAAMGEKYIDIPREKIDRLPTLVAQGEKGGEL